MTSVPGCACGYGTREVGRSRSRTVSVSVREMTGGTVGHVWPRHAGKRGGEPDTPRADENARPNGTRHAGIIRCAHWLANKGKRIDVGPCTPRSRD